MYVTANSVCRNILNDVKEGLISVVRDQNISIREATKNFKVMSITEAEHQWCLERQEANLLTGRLKRLQDSLTRAPFHFMRRHAVSKERIAERRRLTLHELVDAANTAQLSGMAKKKYREVGVVDRREFIARPGLSSEEIKDLAKGPGPGFDTVRCIVSDCPVSSSTLQLFRCQQCLAVVCQLHADHFVHRDWASVNAVQEQQGLRQTGACSFTKCVLPGKHTCEKTQCHRMYYCNFHKLHVNHLRVADSSLVVAAGSTSQARALEPNTVAEIPANQKRPVPRKRAASKTKDTQAVESSIKPNLKQRKSNVAGRKRLGPRAGEVESMGLNDANNLGNQIPAATDSIGTKGHVTSSVIDKRKCSEADQSCSESEGPVDPSSSRCTTDQMKQGKKVKRTTTTVTTTTTVVEFVGGKSYSDDEGSDGNVSV